MRTHNSLTITALYAEFDVMLRNATFSWPGDENEPKHCVTQLVRTRRVKTFVDFIRRYRNLLHLECNGVPSEFVFEIGYITYAYKTESEHSVYHISEDTFDVDIKLETYDGESIVIVHDVFNNRKCVNKLTIRLA